MENKEQTTDIVLVQPEQLTRIMDLNEVYQLNQTSHTRAVEASEMLLKRIWRDGITESVVEEVKQHMLKLKKTIDNMKARRSPVTQIFDEVRSRFTTLENDIDPAKKESYYGKFQAELDKWAKAKLDEERKRKDEQQKLMQSKAEETSIAAEIEAQTKKYFEQMVTREKEGMLKLFDELTLADFEKNPTITLTLKHPKFIIDDLIEIRGQISLFPIHHTVEYVRQQAVEITARIMPVLQQKYLEAMQEFIDDLTAQLPAKRNELQRIADAASQEEAERIKAQATERFNDSMTEIHQQEQKAVEAVQSEAESTKAAGELNAMAQAALPFNDNLPKVKDGYEILVVNPAGWVQICQFYFQKEGMNEQPEKLEKKTLGSMKKFCESYALKYDEKIISANLVYEEKIKAAVK